MQNSKKTFLKDVLICSLGAFGGPEAHYGVFTKELVYKKKYLTEEELIELIALNTVLPGPSSTQTIVSIGYKIGGLSLAVLTFLVWALPAILFMTALSMLYVYLNAFGFPLEGFRLLEPMAIGFVFYAGVKLSKKVLVKPLSFILFLLSFSVTIFYRAAWVFPVLILIGALVEILTSPKVKVVEKPKMRLDFKFLGLFLLILFLSITLVTWTPNLLTYLFERFYRYGYLVIGGGQVVIPYMFHDLVEVSHYLTEAEFLFGYGLVQGIPGPMFSFASFVGGMAASNESIGVQITAGILSGFSLFLPGLFLVFFVYPIWHHLKAYPWMKIALKGITSIAAGLIMATGVYLELGSSFEIGYVIVLIFTIIILFMKKVPSTLWILIVILIGFITL